MFLLYTLRKRWPNKKLFLGRPACRSFVRRSTLRRTYKLAAQEKRFCARLFLSIHTLFAPKKGWGMLVYPPGCWSVAIASSEVIPKKLVFPRQKKWKFRGMRSCALRTHFCLLKKTQTHRKDSFFFFGCFCRKFGHTDLDSREQQPATSDPAKKSGNI